MPNNTQLTQLYRRHLIDFLAGREPQYHIRLSFDGNGTTDIRPAEETLHHFFAMLARKVFGRDWSSLPSDEQLSYAAVPEGHGSHYTYYDLHYHALLSFPGRRPDKLADLVTALWCKATSGSTSRTIRIRRGEDHRLGLANYICKRIVSLDGLAVEHFVIGPPAKHQIRPTSKVIRCRG